jgi:cobalt-zinc-cadmium efflux system membrane fusion protein
MFGQVKLLTAAAGESMVVPVAAVQSIDKQNYVFVRREPDLFEIRRVEAGAKEQGLVTILFGLAPEDEVVVAQGFSLKSEVLKARLGASCADH